MQKIDKSKILSIQYKEWEQELEESSNQHPKYNDTTTKRNFYRDIIMNLLYCQKGLCAYTESKISTNASFKESDWINYKYNIEKFDRVDADLDHFNPDLKSKDGEEGKKDWLWSNFFLVNKTVNNNKRIQKVDEIFKPDTRDYDPMKWLDYEVGTHRFIPKTTLDEIDKIKVRNMISVLGLNLIHCEDRKTEIHKLVDKIELKKLTWDEAKNELKEFPTAFEMCRKQLENQP